ncbi:hypothetical protein HMPREF0673_02322 [Leyella stercorea DSM 18206]|uniref:Uncharacterized protein n=1 Tax=Leyella stercorea DSM 18206 TaxID=1002367 RepID=G6B0A4_9BACT|nr:hypothetical protein HMPREF0673_02322 [Leyella stercorea DSM 18206]
MASLPYPRSHPKGVQRSPLHQPSNLVLGSQPGNPVSGTYCWVDSILKTDLSVCSFANR